MAELEKENLNHDDYIEEEEVDDRKRLILRPITSKTCISLRVGRCPYRDDIRYVVAHDGRGDEKTSVIKSTQVVATGKKYLEAFDTEEEAKEKFPEAEFEKEEKEPIEEEEELTR